MYYLAEVDWSGIFDKDNMLTIGFFGTAIIIVLALAITSSWKHVKIHAKDTQLKRDLAARGYSVDEIERIVSVKQGPDKDK